MCTYQTKTIALEGSGKINGEWVSLDSGAVYFDHPVHAAPMHTLNIDCRNSKGGAESRVALELSAESARTLAKAIEEVLEATPPLHS